jgi:glycine cleavage system H protein
LPLAGEIVEFNDALEAPEAVNADPYGAGWMIKLKFQCCGLRFFADAYKELIGA